MSDAEEIISLARAFWQNHHLIDLDRTAHLIREVDLPKLVILPGSIAHRSAQVRDRPELQAVRAQIRGQVNKSYNYPAPTIAANGLSGKLQTEYVRAEIPRLVELELIYNIYLGELFRSQETGEPSPDLYELTSRITARGSSEQKSVKSQAASILKRKMPRLRVEKTTRGWRIDYKYYYSPDSVTEKIHGD